MYEPLKGVVQCRVNFPRALFGLRAAHLNQQVVVTGGYDGRSNRDEVLCGIPFNCLCFVLSPGASVQC